MYGRVIIQFTTSLLTIKLHISISILIQIVL